MILSTVENVTRSSHPFYKIDVGVASVGGGRGFPDARKKRWSLSSFSFLSVVE